jgi:putative ABC transport system permease protein
MKWQIIFSGLRARPVRTGVTIMAVSLQVALILVIVGLTTGTANEIGKRIAGVGADIMFQAPGADVLLAANGANLKEKYGSELATKDGIQRVAPVLVKISTAPLVNIFGIDPQSFDEVSGGFEYLDGKVFSEPDEIVIDDIFSRDKKLKVGDSIELIKHTFKVSGIVLNGKGSRVFMGLKASQDLNNSPNMVSIFFIKLKDSRNINGAIEKLSADFPGYELRNVPEYAALMNGASIPGFDAFNAVVVFVALCIGVMVIFLSMYTTIMERTREIGILRSLGASKMFIVTLIMKESILLCVIGVILGTMGRYLIVSIAKSFFPSLAFMIDYKWMIIAAISALVSGVVGSLHPALKAASQDPVEAFAYE